MSAGGRKERSSRVRSSHASHARLSSFLPLRTPATQATIIVDLSTYSARANVLNIPTQLECLLQKSHQIVVDLDGDNNSLSPGQTESQVDATELKTWVYLQLRLPRACGALALTCDDLRSLWSRSNLYASRSKFSPFGHPTQVSTQVQLTSTCDHLQVRLARALQRRLGK